MVGVVSNPFQKYTPAEMRQMQLDDTTIQPVHCAVSCGQPTSPDIVKSCMESRKSSPDATLGRPLHL